MPKPAIFVVENASELRGALRSQIATPVTKAEVKNQENSLLTSVAGCDAYVWINSKKSVTFIGFRQDQITLEAAKTILQEELGQ